MRIAMVCLGNICRSPMAAVVASSMVDDAGLANSVTVESYGTAGYHTGEGAHPCAEEALRRRGYSAIDHRARKLHASDLSALDLVLCADLSNLADVKRLAGRAGPQPEIAMLRSFDPRSGKDDEVPDPWGLEDVVFDSVLKLIERSCRGLVDHLVSERVGSSS